MLATQTEENIMLCTISKRLKQTIYWLSYLYLLIFKFEYKRLELMILLRKTKWRSNNQLCL